MTSKIFRNSFLVGVAVFFLSIALFMGVLYQYFGSQLLIQLESEAALAARGVEMGSMDYLDGLSSANRITWIDAGGTVLFDNQADPAQMENHADREEVRAALESETGTASRYSTTLSQRTLYFAQRLADGTVLRVSSEQRSLPSLLLSMVQPILIILVLAVALSAVLASRLSKHIIKPVLAIDLEHPEDSDTYEELTPLLSRIKQQNQTIAQQMAQLRQKQNEFTAITENMSEGFLLLDRQGRILSHNSGALRLLHAAAPEERASYLTLNRTERFRQAVDAALTGRRDEQLVDLGGRCCQLLANPVIQDGQVAGAVLVILDVTEREQREELRREFTANVSHELKTPLTSISGIAEIIKGGLVKPQDIPGFADDIYGEAQRMIRLVEDILRLSQLDEGGSSLQTEEVDLYHLAQEVAGRLTPAAVKGQVTLEVTGGPVRISGVRQLLDEMISNLCDNAIKYNRPGGRVTISVSRSDRGAELSVSDTGIGIPPEDQSRVFERFYRVDKSHSKASGGTGLGLSIVKRLVEAMGGQITFTSRKGVGTTFCVTLPFEIDRHYAPAPDEEETEGSSWLEGIHVLLAEDNELNMEIAEFLLLDRGASVTRAWNGKEALDAFADAPEGAFDVILMDIMMPVMNGLDTVRAIRALDRPDAAEIPIIAMSANAFSDDIQQSLDAGFNAHVAKPIDASLLAQTLRKFVSPPLCP